MGLVRLELTTSRLKARYSTIELQTHKRFKFSRCLVVSQPLLKNTTEPVEEQVVCASSRSGPEHLGSRSPTDLCNIPGFGPQWQIIRPVTQVAQDLNNSALVCWRLSGRMGQKCPISYINTNANKL